MRCEHILEEGGGRGGRGRNWVGILRIPQLAIRPTILQIGLGGIFIYQLSLLHGLATSVE